MNNRLLICRPIGLVGFVVSLLGTILISAAHGAASPRPESEFMGASPVGDMRQSSQRPVTIRRFGFYSLRRLGYADFTLTPKRVRPVRAYYNASRSIPYVLPAGSSQGPKNWYLVRFHFRIRFGPGGEGYALVGASPRGGAAVLVKFKPRDDWIAWSTFGLVQGSLEGKTREREIEITYTNYMTIDGAGPGRHDLVFWEEHSDGMQVESVRVFADSGVEYSPLGPARLKASAYAVPQEVRVGERFEFRLRLQNVGERPVKYASVFLELPEGILSLGSQQRRLPGIRGKREVVAVFPLRAARAGAYVMHASVTSSSNSPAAAARVLARAP